MKIVNTLYFHVTMELSQGLFSQIISNFPERGILWKALPGHNEIKEEEINNYIWKNKYSSAWKNFKVLVTWSCPTLCNLMDSSPPGSFVHGISQARILEWVAISSSRGSSRTRDRTRVFCICYIGRQILYHWGTWEAPKEVYVLLNLFVFVLLSCLLLRGS